VGRADAEKLLRGVTDHQVVARLFGTTPWIFQNNTAQYDAWRAAVAATHAAFSPDGVRVVGSSAFGFSLSPTKAGRDFRRTGESYQRSDIDVVLVSESMFIEIWNELLDRERARTLTSTLDSRGKMREDIYNGHVINALIPDGTNASRVVRGAIATTTSVAPFRGHIAKARIYRRLEDAFAYHLWSVGMLRKELGVQG